MLQAQLIGHLGKDCMVNNVNGKSVINFNVAHSEQWTDAQGVKNTRSIWVDCSYWTDKTSIAQYLKKGTQVFVQGNIDSRVYTPPNGGQPTSQITCRVMNVQLLGGKKEEGQQPAQVTQQYSQPATSTPTESVDDLPF
jgi:single-strand DNA-binding protein